MRTGIDDDQRDPDALLVEQLLLAQPVIAQVIAVVGGERDRRVVEQAAVGQERHKPPDMVVELLHQTHIGRDDRPPGLLSRENATLSP